MNKSTKVFAGITTALALAGTGTATYFGVKNSQLQAKHDKYVQESTLRDEESKQKIAELEQTNLELLRQLLEYEGKDTNTPIIPPSLYKQ